MRVDLNARVRTRDGHDAGKIRYVVFDPDVADVTHFVVKAGGFLGRDIVVPADLIVPPEIADDTSYQEETVVLNLSEAELGEMPDFDPTLYGRAPSGWVAPETYAYPASNYLWLGRYWNDSRARAASIAGEEEAPGASRESAIGKGDPVLDNHGDEVGVVEDLRFDTRRDDMTALVVRTGGALQQLLRTAETIEIPRELIESVSPNGVHLRVTRSEIQDLARSRRAGAWQGPPSSGSAQ